jgi:hypothetical protein
VESAKKPEVKLTGIREAVGNISSKKFYRKRFSKKGFWQSPAP